jgi:hypothetical protein
MRSVCGMGKYCVFNPKVNAGFSPVTEVIYLSESAAFVNL